MRTDLQSRRNPGAGGVEEEEGPGLGGDGEDAAQGGETESEAYGT